MKIEEYVPEYWEGWSNVLVRYWVYLHRGLDMVNQARYLILGILALYALLKLTNPLWIIIMFLVSVPILIAIGHWQLYRVSRTQEFIMTTKGTVLGYSQYNLTDEQVRLLKEILLKLNENTTH